MPTRCTVAASCSCNRTSCSPGWSRHAGKPDKPDHTFGREPTTLPKPTRSPKSSKPARASESPLLTNATAQRQPLPPPEPIRRKSSRVIWCPCERGCAGPRGTGKPLQIAVDGAAATVHRPATALSAVKAPAATSRAGARSSWASVASRSVMSPLSIQAPRAKMRQHDECGGKRASIRFPRQ